MDGNGFRGLCVREIQKSLQESVKPLLESKIRDLGVENYFEVLTNEIRTPGGGVITFIGMAQHTAMSVKSYEGFDVAWVEEASQLSQRSLDLLRPTIRKPGSQIWFSWNPDSQDDAVDKFLRRNTPPNARVVRVNFDDNPWLPAELADEMELDREDEDKFAHVWLGDYRKANEGAYFATQLRQARDSGRVGVVSLDPLQPLYASWDIGVSDATAIWVSQWQAGQIRFVDYCEGRGQALGYYLNWLRNRGYEAGKCILPHDAAARDAVTAIRFEDHIRSAGFAAETVPNQGKGAAMRRIEAARRWFPRMLFDGEKCEHGLKALANYHPKLDDNRPGIDLGPEHDWSSHGADSFGLMAVAYREPIARSFRAPERNMRVYA